MTISIKNILKNWEEVKGKIGPWPWTEKVDEHCKDWHVVFGLKTHPVDVCRVSPWSGMAESNAEFIASAPQTISALCEGMKKAIVCIEFYAASENNADEDSRGGSSKVWHDDGRLARQTLTDLGIKSGSF